MAYIDTRTPQDRAKSVAGVVAVHGALAYALLVGLQATGVIESVPRLTGETITEVPIEPPPPPPKPDEAVEDPAPSRTQTYVPEPEIDLVREDPVVPTLVDPLPPLDPVVIEAFPTTAATPRSTGPSGAKPNRSVYSGSCQATALE